MLTKFISTVKQKTFRLKGLSLPPLSQQAKWGFSKERPYEAYYLDYKFTMIIYIIVVF